MEFWVGAVRAFRSTIAAGESPSPQITGGKLAPPSRSYIATAFGCGNKI